MIDKWLLEQSTLDAMRAAPLPTAAQSAEFAATVVAEANADMPRILTVAGNNAQINVKGVLTKERSWMAAFFGGGNTTYGEIISALAVAEADPSIRSIVLHVDSGGGQISGMFEAMAVLQASKKPITTLVSGMAASAAFGLASQTDSIMAESRASQVGSIGVAATFHVSDREVTITSSNAPKKRPDVSTEEGKAMVREELDALEALFIDDIAAGRNKSVATVTAEFGQGGILLAEEAKKRGMIDSIITSFPKPKASRGASKMDIAELKAQHPEVFQAAVDVGATAERDRVEAHLISGKATDAMDVAMAAIEDGSPMTDKLRATYMAAGQKTKEIAAVNADDDETSKAARVALDTTAEKSDADKVWDAHEANKEREGVV